MITLLTGVPGWLGSRFYEALVSASDPLSTWNSCKKRQLRILVHPSFQKGIPVEKTLNIS